MEQQTQQTDIKATFPSGESTGEPCPKCGKDLHYGPGMSGVKCSDEYCDYWFCY